MKITVQQLKKLGACQEGIDWFKKSKKHSLKAVISACLKDSHSDYAWWLVKQLLTKEQAVLIAIFSAELCLNTYEKKYPNDDRPRKAIQAAKDFLSGKINENAVRAAWNAAGSVAWNAAGSAAWSAAYAVKSSAGNAAGSAADAVKNDAESAVSAAYNAVSDAYAVSAARNTTTQKILFYAVMLLGE